MSNKDGKGQTTSVGSDVCTCPKCGYEMEHQRGKPCSQGKCPKCGTEMQGANCA